MTAAWLTNREVASLVVGALLVVVLVAATWKSGALRSLGSALLGFLHWKIATPIFMPLGCLSVAVWVASRLGMWEPGLWRPTALRLGLGGIGLLIQV